ncbi:zinc finger protein 773-like isoform X39 [Branchiostoma lanceolatum]|uniref:zinc finger protein 773-like isoform X39 n=1 Tax=Branchiostoma lanceolatum TaxID=7740 RepID=UPI003456ED95
MRQKQAPLRVEDDIESEDITMAAAVSEDFHRESGDGLCGDFSCPHCAFSVDQDVMLKVLKHFFNCTSLQYIIDISVGNAATLGATKPPAPRRASKAPQPHSEPVRHSEPPTKRRATEARATPPQESPRIVTTQAPTLLARLNAAQSRTQTVHASSQREIPSEPEHHTRPVTTRQVETVQPRAPETTTTTTTAANIQLPSIPTIKEEPGAGAACIVEPTAPTLFDEPMHTQKDTDSAMGMKRDTDTVGGMLDALPGTSSSGLFSEDLNFGGAGPSFVQSDPSQEDSTSGNGHHDLQESGLVDRAERGLSPWQHDIRESGPPATISSVSVNPYKCEGHPVEHTCRQCGQSFDSNQTLLNHIQILHWRSEDSAGESSDATSAAATLTAWSGHWNQGTSSYVNPEESLENACSHCGKKFELRSKLLKHVKSLHQRITCTICGLELSNKFNHDRHVRMKHSSQRDYACDLCGKTFKRSDHLQRHMQSAHPSWWQ